MKTKLLAIFIVISTSVSAFSVDKSEMSKYYGDISYHQNGEIYLQSFGAD